jgi:two-component system LytT family response regulator
MKKSFRALVIDDERLARKDLIALLGAHDQVTVVGEAEDVPSAINTIQALNPDVIFLDIQMPGDSGFDLLEKTEVKAHIIFVTAYDEYAIRAFEVNALDYLLKPVNPERLAKALEKLELQEREPRAEIRKLNYDDRLFLMVGRSFKFLPVNAILNMNFVERVETWFNYSFKVYIKGVKEPLVISRRYATQLKDKLG